MSKKGLTFDDIGDEFGKRTRRIVWCSVATVNRENRPRTRILHPIWEGPNGWIATARHSAKADDIAHNPYVSLAYWDQQHEQVHVDARAHWEDDLSEKGRIWHLFGSIEPPAGYDLGAFWGSPADPDYGLLKLTPWRIEVYSLGALFEGKKPLVWIPEHERDVK